MKQAIEFYYSLRVENLTVENKGYHFSSDKLDYYFLFCNREISEIDEILSCVSELRGKHIPVHNILMNNQGNYITKIDDLSYILLQIDNKMETYDLIKMIEYNKKLRLSEEKNALYKNNWEELWSKKIDNIENSLQAISKNAIIENTINYYIGLAENAIYYVHVITHKYEKTINDDVVLSRKRIGYPNYRLNYFNPVSFIFDLEVRDIGEYIKSLFWANEDAILELKTYLRLSKLTTYSYNMLFARLLFPTYYFDAYDLFINKDNNIDNIIEIAKKSKEYEMFLKKAYEEISSYANLETIDWLIFPH